jgi:hypothetical protein
MHQQSWPLRLGTAAVCLESDWQASFDLQLLALGVL